ncbi:MAG: HAD hydrolase family protein, partial [Candidatus Omnitrophica bacterium]|nr:HAD hydrolase family protein [Candidatus Omnitrophota bacterium]
MAGKNAILIGLKPSSVAILKKEPYQDMPAHITSLSDYIVKKELNLPVPTSDRQDASGDIYLRMDTLLKNISALGGKDGQFRYELDILYKIVNEYTSMLINRNYSKSARANLVNLVQDLNKDGFGMLADRIWDSDKMHHGSVCVSIIINSIRTNDIKASEWLTESLGNFLNLLPRKMRHDTINNLNAFYFESMIRDKGFIHEFTNKKKRMFKQWLPAPKEESHSGRFSDKEPMGSNAAVSWINIIAGALFVAILFIPRLFGIDIFGIDTVSIVSQKIDIISAIYFTSFLVIHELSHWLQTCFKKFFLKKLFTKEGISIPGSKPWPGILASSTLALISLALLLILPQYSLYLIPAIIINTIFALSKADIKGALKTLPVRMRVGLAPDDAHDAPAYFDGLSSDEIGEDTRLASNSNVQVRPLYMLFRQINGLMLIPMLRTLVKECMEKNALEELFGTQDKPRPVTAGDISKRLKRKGYRKSLFRILTIKTMFRALLSPWLHKDPEENVGNITNAMRLFVIQGWMKMQKKENGKVDFQFTELGWEAVMLARYGYFDEACVAIRHLKNFPVYFRGPPRWGWQKKRRQKALEEYKALVEKSRVDWGIVALKYDNKIAKRVKRQSREHLDGMLMTSTMVSLGMPLYKRKGEVIEKVGPSIFELFDKETNTLDLGTLDPRQYHLEFLNQAFNLLELKKVITRQGKNKAIIKLTELGYKLKELNGSYWVTDAYLKLFEMNDELLFGNPVLLNVDKDEHMQTNPFYEFVNELFDNPVLSFDKRMQDIAGSKLAHATYLRAIIKLLMGKSKKVEEAQDQAISVFKKPAEAQPVGLIDIGGGTGEHAVEAAESLVEFILTETDRDLREYPLVVIVADFNRSAIRRAKAVLNEFKESLKGEEFKARLNKRLEQLKSENENSKEFKRLKHTIEKLDEVIEQGLVVKALRADVTDQDKLDRDIKKFIRSHVQKNKILSIAFEKAGLVDFVTLRMFLDEERSLRIQTPDRAMEIIRKSVKKVDRRLLFRVLQNEFDGEILGNEALPKTEDEFMEWDEGRVVDLIVNQFTIPQAYRGRSIPAIVAVADYIDFLKRSSRFATLHPDIVVEQHPPRRLTPAFQEKLQAVPEDPNEATVQDKILSQAYWTTQSFSHQYLIPYQEHLLAIVLAGLEHEVLEVHPRKDTGLPTGIRTIAYRRPSGVSSPKTLKRDLGTFMPKLKLRKRLPIDERIRKLYTENKLGRFKISNEERDSFLYLLTHADRAAFYFVLLGKRFGLEKDEIRSGYLAALIKDIGKRQNSEILKLANLKKLTKEQYENVVRHGELSLRIARDEGIPLPLEAQKAILYHHHFKDIDNDPDLGDQALRQKVKKITQLLIVASHFDLERPYLKGFVPSIERISKEIEKKYKQGILDKALYDEICSILKRARGILRKGKKKNQEIAIYDALVRALRERPQVTEKAISEKPFIQKKEILKAILEAVQKEGPINDAYILHFVYKELGLTGKDRNKRLRKMILDQIDILLNDGEITVVHTMAKDKDRLFVRPDKLRQLLADGGAVRIIRDDEVERKVMVTDKVREFLSNMTKEVFDESGQKTYYSLKIYNQKAAQGQIEFIKGRKGEDIAYLSSTIHKLFRMNEIETGLTDIDKTSKLIRFLRQDRDRYRISICNKEFISLETRYREHYKPRPNEGQVVLIRDAYKLARSIYDEKTFEVSGELYLEHTLNVAKGAMDGHTVAAAFLHKVPQGQREVIKKIKGGKRIIEILKKYDRASNMPYYPPSPKELKATYTIQNYIEEIIQLAEEPEIMSLVLADMQAVTNAISALPEDLYRQILEIYAPVAESFGIETIAVEFKDRAFRLNQPEEYKRVREKMEEVLTGLSGSKEPLSLEDAKIYLKKKRREIHRILKDAKCDVDVYTRVKTPFSVANKLKRQGIKVEDMRAEDVLDLLGIKIVFKYDSEEKERREDKKWLTSDITEYLKGETGEILDELKLIKGEYGNYERLGVHVKGDDGFIISLHGVNQSQYREERSGVAAHWQYKLSKYLGRYSQQFRKEGIKLTGDFLHDFRAKLDTLKDWIYINEVIEEDGEEFLIPVRLKAGSTVLDYALEKGIREREVGGIKLFDARYVYDHEKKEGRLETKEQKKYYRGRDYILKTGEVVRLVVPKANRKSKKSLSVESAFNYSAIGVLALLPGFVEMDPVLALGLRIAGFIGLVAPFLMAVSKGVGPKARLAEVFGKIFRKIFGLVPASKVFLAALSIILGLGIFVLSYYVFGQDILSAGIEGMVTAGGIPVLIDKDSISIASNLAVNLALKLSQVKFFGGIFRRLWQIIGVSKYIQDDNIILPEDENGQDFKNYFKFEDSGRRFYIEPGTGRESFRRVFDHHRDLLVERVYEKDGALKEVMLTNVMRNNPISRENEDIKLKLESSSKRFGETLYKAAVFNNVEEVGKFEYIVHDKGISLLRDIWIEPQHRNQGIELSIMNYLSLWVEIKLRTHRLTDEIEAPKRSVEDFIHLSVIDARSPSTIELVKQVTHHRGMFIEGKLREEVDIEKEFGPVHLDVDGKRLITERPFGISGLTSPVGVLDKDSANARAAFIKASGNLFEPKDISPALKNDKVISMLLDPSGEKFRGPEPIPYSFIIPEEIAEGLRKGEGGMHTTRDITPTLLALRGIPQESRMTGDSLLIPNMSGKKKEEVALEIMEEAAFGSFSLLKKDNYKRIKKAMEFLPHFRDENVVRWFKEKLHDRIEAMCELQDKTISEILDRLPRNEFRECFDLYERKFGAYSSELSNKFMDEYKGVVYENGELKLEDKYGEKAISFKEILESAFSLRPRLSIVFAWLKIRQFMGRYLTFLGVPKIHFQVTPDLVTDAVSYRDAEGDFHIIFDQRYIDLMLRYKNNEKFKESMARFFVRLIDHRLLHVNKSNSRFIEMAEETLFIIFVDIAYFKYFLITDKQFRVFVEEVMPWLRRTNYLRWIFGYCRNNVLFLVLTAPAVITRYVVNRYNFDHKRGGIKTIEPERVRFVKEGNLVLRLEEGKTVKVSDAYGNSMVDMVYRAGGSLEGVKLYNVLGSEDIRLKFSEDMSDGISGLRSYNTYTVDVYSVSGDNYIASFRFKIVTGRGTVGDVNVGQHVELIGDIQVDPKAEEAIKGLKSTILNYLAIISSIKCKESNYSIVARDINIEEGETPTYDAIEFSSIIRGEKGQGIYIVPAEENLVTVCANILPIENLYANIHALIEVISEKLTKDIHITEKQMDWLESYLWDLTPDVIKNSPEALLMVVVPKAADKEDLIDTFEDMNLTQHDTERLIKALRDRRPKARIFIPGDEAPFEADISDIVEQYVNSLNPAGRLDDRLTEVVNEYIPRNMRRLIKAKLREMKWNEARINFIVRFLEERDADSDLFMPAFDWITSNFRVDAGDSSGESIQVFLEKEALNKILEQIDKAEKDMPLAGLFSGNDLRNSGSNILPEQLIGSFGVGACYKKEDVEQEIKIVDYIIRTMLAEKTRRVLKIIESLNGANIRSKSGRMFEVEFSTVSPEKQVIVVASKKYTIAEEVNIEQYPGNYVLYIKDSGTGRRIENVYWEGHVDYDGTVWVDYADFKDIDERGLVSAIASILGERLKGLPYKIKVKLYVSEINSLLLLAENLGNPDLFKDSLSKESAEIIKDNMGKYRLLKNGSSFEEKGSFEELIYNLSIIISKHAPSKEIMKGLLWNKVYSKMGLSNVKLIPEHGRLLLAGETRKGMFNFINTMLRSKSGGPDKIASNNILGQVLHKAAKWVVKQKSALLNKRFKLYVFDFDDTLAKAGHRITKKMLKELLFILEQGGHVAILTGRGMHQVDDVAGLKKLLVERIDKKTRIEYWDKIHFLCEAGGSIWGFNKEGKLIKDEETSRALTKKEKAKIKENIHTALEELGLGEYLDGKRLKIVERESEVSLFFKTKKMQKHLDAVKGKLEDALKEMDVNVERSSIAMDVTRVTKEETIEVLRKKLDIQAKDILVGADGYNDLGMLRVVLEQGGTAIFAGNPEILKVLSNYINNIVTVKGPAGLRKALKYINNSIVDRRFYRRIIERINPLAGLDFDFVDDTERRMQFKEYLCGTFGENFDFGYDYAFINYEPARDKEIYKALFWILKGNFNFELRNPIFNPDGFGGVDSILQSRAFINYRDEYFKGFIRPNGKLLVFYTVYELLKNIRELGFGMAETNFFLGIKNVLEGGRKGIELTFIDDGPGFEDIQRVFQERYSSKKSAKADTKGYGCFLCYCLIVLAGLGDIKVVSNGKEAVYVSGESDPQVQDIKNNDLTQIEISIFQPENAKVASNQNLRELLEKIKQVESVKKIEHALLNSFGNISKAARALGIDPSTLRARMENLGIRFEKDEPVFNTDKVKEGKGLKEIDFPDEGMTINELRHALFYEALKKTNEKWNDALRLLGIGWNWKPGARLASVDLTKEPEIKITLPTGGVNLIELEWELIWWTLNKAGGSYNKAASRLGIDRKDLHVLVNKSGIKKAWEAVQLSKTIEGLRNYSVIGDSRFKEAVKIMLGKTFLSEEKLKSVLLPIDFYLKPSLSLLDLEAELKDELGLPPFKISFVINSLASLKQRLEKRARKKLEEIQKPISSSLTFKNARRLALGGIAVILVLSSFYAGLIALTLSFF